MNFDNQCVLANAGDRIRITNKATEVVLEGKARRDIRDGSLEFAISIDGTQKANMFTTSEWHICVLPPVIEEGLYVGNGNIYRVTDHLIRYMPAHMENEAAVSSVTRVEFARRIKSGSIVRFAGLNGRSA